MHYSLWLWLKTLVLLSLSSGLGLAGIDIVIRSRALSKFDMELYDFDGCMYGIKSILPKSLGTPIRKPWRLATNNPDIGLAFSRKCDGSHPRHAICEGGDTKQTENYSRRFADTFHRAFRESCRS